MDEQKPPPGCVVQLFQDVLGTAAMWIVFHAALGILTFIFFSIMPSREMRSDKAAEQIQKLAPTTKVEADFNSDPPIYVFVDLGNNDKLIASANLDHQGTFSGGFVEGPSAATPKLREMTLEQFAAQAEQSAQKLKLDAGVVE